MDAKEMWLRFCRKENIAPDTPYEAWAFGGAPDKLAELVLRGIKTGTASGYDLYALDNSEPVPEAGDYSVVLSSKDEALCVIRTTKVYAVPFRDVTADHAFKEGEGDRSLNYWRQVHWDFFAEEFDAYGIQFNEDRMILCEEFEVVYREEE